MKIFDAHRHVYKGAVIRDARESGYICCGTHPGDWLDVEHICLDRDHAYAAYGVHPWYVAEACDPLLLDRLSQYLVRDPCAGVGEIGLDHSRKGLDRQMQQELFVGQLRLALSMTRFVCMHCVRAWGALLQCLDAVDVASGRLMVHGFGGSAEVASELVKRGVYLSFGGSKEQAAKQERIVAGLPVASLLIETDAGGGGGAEASWIENWEATLLRLARARGEDPVELADAVFRNSLRFLGLGR